MALQQHCAQPSGPGRAKIQLSGLQFPALTISMYMYNYNLMLSIHRLLLYGMEVNRSISNFTNMITKSICYSNFQQRLQQVQNVPCCPSLIASLSDKS